LRRALEAAEKRGTAQELERSVGYRAVDGEELLQLATQTDREVPVLLVVDQQMPRRTGLDTLEANRAAGCDSPAILVSGTSLPDPRRGQWPCSGILPPETVWGGITVRRRLDAQQALG
jgi:CheY-like chemotaxis protein